jgi:hypothetical protein
MVENGQYFTLCTFYCKMYCGSMGYLILSTTHLVPAVYQLRKLDVLVLTYFFKAYTIRCSLTSFFSVFVSRAVRNITSEFKRGRKFPRLRSLTTGSQ